MTADDQQRFEMLDAAVRCDDRATQASAMLSRRRAVISEMRALCEDDPAVLSDIDGFETGSERHGVIGLLTAGRQVDVMSARAWREHARRVWRPVVTSVPVPAASRPASRRRGTGSRPAARRASGPRSGSDPGGDSDPPPAPPLRLWRLFGSASASLIRLLLRIAGQR